MEIFEREHGPDLPVLVDRINHVITAFILDTVIKAFMTVPPDLRTGNSSTTMLFHSVMAGCRCWRVVQPELQR
jgi:hypothetical protein